MCVDFPSSLQQLPAQQMLRLVRTGSATASDVLLHGHNGLYVMDSAAHEPQQPVTRPAGAARLDKHAGAPTSLPMPPSSLLPIQCVASIPAYPRHAQVSVPPPLGSSGAPLPGLTNILRALLFSLCRSSSSLEKGTAAPAGDKDKAGQRLLREIVIGQHCTKQAALVETGTDTGHTVSAAAV
jgi:hypothetical protein